MFCGTSPEAPVIGAIRAPVLGHYGGDDERVTASGATGPAATGEPEGHAGGPAGTEGEPGGSGLSKVISRPKSLFARPDPIGVGQAAVFVAVIFR